MPATPRSSPRSTACHVCTIAVGALKSEAPAAQHADDAPAVPVQLRGRHVDEGAVGIVRVVDVPHHAPFLPQRVHPSTEAGGDSSASTEMPPARAASTAMA